MRQSKKYILLCLVIAMIVALVPVVSAGEMEKIDINQASVEELAQLKRIGPKYAERIIQYREQHGPFGRPEDIMKVAGIGLKTWEVNMDRISVEPQ
ncbi:MAG: ComEA family DNA-binding protein [Desulfobacterales bacterium]|nr:ComEA family DNA-binding protein [Desulfobacterales bacterium]